MEPNIHIPYNHIQLQTPLGLYIISWKGWKQYQINCYSIIFNGDWIAVETDLGSAKKVAENYILQTAKELNEFIKDQNI